MGYHTVSSLREHLAALRFGWTAARPQEHGAWVILLVPLALGTVISSVWSLAGVLGWVVCVGGLLLWPTASVASKATRRGSPLPWGPLVIIGSIVTISGAWIVALRPWFLVWIAGDLLLIGLELMWGARRSRPVALQQSIAVAGLSQGAALIPYLAGGEIAYEPFGLWALCAGYFGASYICVKTRAQWAVRPQTSTAGSRLFFTAVNTGLLSIGGVLGWWFGLSIWVLASLSPTAVRGVYTAVKPPQS
ncbi:MAG: YwiC-like family protein, partial [Candidatus Latescibacteria bacterium]|nr:YwiC-like family protein [Candidatus Latescibacterota bacterium]